MNLTGLPCSFTTARNDDYSIDSVFFISLIFSGFFGKPQNDEGLFCGEVAQSGFYGLPRKDKPCSQ
ncbi:hypothetical protein [Helicobacter fennelliae]|uniref:hypothetical protein n=1 Tax=Helicobacter fennelliae TaxID=215 RepID=UPI0011BEF680|nr:hypothetical protein [Helicobacter fennelliae]